MLLFFKKKMEILLHFSSFLQWKVFKKSKIAQIYYYDFQFAGINLHSPQSDSTPWKLTLFHVQFLRGSWCRNRSKRSPFVDALRRHFSRPNLPYVYFNQGRSRIGSSINPRAIAYGRSGVRSRLTRPRYKKWNDSLLCNAIV